MLIQDSFFFMGREIEVSHRLIQIRLCLRVMVFLEKTVLVKFRGLRRVLKLKL